MHDNMTRWEQGGLNSSCDPLGTGQGRRGTPDPRPIVVRQQEGISQHHSSLCDMSSCAWTMIEP